MNDSEAPALTAEEWSEWRAQRGTRALMWLILEEAEAMSEALATGQTLGSAAEDCQRLTVAHVHCRKGLLQVLELIQGPLLPVNDS